jgi:hypothetical protein
VIVVVDGDVKVAVVQYSVRGQPSESPHPAAAADPRKARLIIRSESVLERYILSDFASIVCICDVELKSFSLAKDLETASSSYTPIVFPILSACFS